MYSFFRDTNNADTASEGSAATGAFGEEDSLGMDSPGTTAANSTPAPAQGAATPPATSPFATATANGVPPSSMFRSMNLDATPESSASTNPAIGKCAKVNVDESELDMMLHCTNPDCVESGSDTFAWASWKIMPSFTDGMKHKIHEGGHSADVMLLWPDNHKDPCNLLGCRLSKESVLFQTYDEAIMEMVASRESDLSVKLVLDLPFEAERFPSDDLFGPGTGNSVGLVKIRENAHVNDKVANFCPVYKKQGNQFENSKKVSMETFDNRDMGSSLPRTQAAGNSNRASGSASVASGQTFLSARSNSSATHMNSSATRRRSPKKKRGNLKDERNFI